MNDQPIRILFVLQLVGHPRDSKRIKMLQDEGFEVEAVAFERDYHTGRKPTCSVTTLGKIRHRRYIARLLKFVKALPCMRSAVARNDVVYASGQDVAFLAYLAGLGLSRPVVVEVGDLVNLQLSDDIKGKVVRKLDQWITARYALLVVISEGFLDTYYRKWLGIKTRGLVIQNKLESELASYACTDSEYLPNDDCPILDRPLRIGYFGLLRDYWSWQVLSTLADLHPEKFEIILAGLPVNPPDLDKRTKHRANVTFVGEYRSPEDLPMLYKRVDMIWACYPEIKRMDWNLRWGRPNRFYESCFFKKPCFARAGSLFAEDVKRFDIGSLIDDIDVGKVVNQIAEISHDDFLKWREALAHLPEGVYLYTDESRKLAEEIIKLR